ncbi:MAG: hypothetical protein V3S69_00070, partial [Dehalococcoidales bacterium]
MAGSPFQNNPTVADIAPVQQHGGFTPIQGAESIVAASAQALSAVGEVVKDNYVTELKEGIATKARSIELALTARAFPKFANQLLSEHAKDDPVVKGAMAEMLDIQNAMAQGVLPSTFAMQRLSVIKANAIAEAPEFASEITAAVQDVSGRDPDKALFAELLSPGAVSLSAEEKGIEKAEIKIAETMRLTGATRDEVIEIGRTQQIATLEEQRLKSLT